MLAKCKGIRQLLKIDYIDVLDSHMVRAAQTPFSLLGRFQIIIVPRSKKIPVSDLFSKQISGKEGK